VGDAKRYQLTLTEIQLQVVQNALDMYFRVGMGQLREVTEHLIDHDLEMGEWCKRRDLVDAIMAAAKLAARPELTGNASHSISSDKIDDSNRIACEVHNVIRHHLAWERKPEGGFGVSWDQPMQYSQEPMAVISQVGAESAK